MTSAFSNNSTKATFKKHHPYEVVNSVEDAKLVSNAISDSKRYPHRAEVTIVGNVTLRPYDPIYLDGLPNGMSGYWTVLSITHRFGGRPAYYMCDLVVGTDKIGDTNPNAASTAALRDIDAELAGKSLNVSDSLLVDISLSPNSSDLPQPDTSVFGPKTTPSAFTILNPTNDPNAIVPPNFNNLKSTTYWKASKSTQVLK